MQTRKLERTKGLRGILPQENFKFKPSEMAKNASKTAIRPKFKLIDFEAKPNTLNG